MKAIALIPGTTQFELIELPEPQIERPDEIKIKVLEVGICGTDRELAASGRAIAPLGEKHLIIGHEMLGEIKEIGKDVKGFKIGDLAIVTVRRGCGKCASCLADRADMCYREDYVERGIKGLHGFQAEYVVDRENFFVKVPPSIRFCGVLCEPMSIVEKAIEEIVGIQKLRLLDWSEPEDLKQKQVLVAGMGVIGLLACLVLTLRGFKVFGFGKTSNSIRVKIFEDIGGTFIDGNSFLPKEIPIQFGPMDLIVEAAGAAELNFHLLEALGANGGFVFTGLPDPKAIFPINGGHIVHELVLKNQIVLGSVNAAKKHWKLAIDDLEQGQKKWPKIMSKLITSRFKKEQFKEICQTRSKDEIKCVIAWE